jgi:hypothetical protein
MNGECRHRAIEAPVRERQLLGDGVYGLGQMGRSLSAHGSGGLDGRHLPIRRLVRSRACADIQDGQTIPERLMDQGGNSGLGTAMRGISTPDLPIVDVASASIG